MRVKFWLQVWGDNTYVWWFISEYNSGLFGDYRHHQSWNYHFHFVWKNYIYLILESLNFNFATLLVFESFFWLRKKLFVHTLSLIQTHLYDWLNSIAAKYQYHKWFQVTVKNLAEEDRIVLYAGANYSVTGKNENHFHSAPWFYISDHFPRCWPSDYYHRQVI